MQPHVCALHNNASSIHLGVARGVPPTSFQLPRPLARARVQETRSASLNPRDCAKRRLEATAATQPSTDPRNNKSFVLSSVSELDDDSSAQQASPSQDRNGQSSASTSGRGQAGLSGSQFWEDLLSSPEPEMFGGRAKSASDAAVLRRKGHLKEQDKMIEFLLAMHHTHTSEEVMQKMERWILEHRQDPRNSRLRRMVPTVGSFFTPLKLVEAFKEFDQFFALSRRKYVPPNFAEIRHILNIAQVAQLSQMCMRFCNWLLQLVCGGFFSFCILEL